MYRLGSLEWKVKDFLCHLVKKRMISVSVPAQWDGFTGLSKRIQVLSRG